MIGDGSVYVTSNTTLRARKAVRVPIPRVELKNKSPGFLAKFNGECALVLGRESVRVSAPNREGHSMVRYTANGFVSWWLTRILNNLQELIVAFPIVYLRGRFDSDSSVG